MPALPPSAAPPAFSYLELNERGVFVDGGKEISTLATHEFLKRKIWIDADVTDVFVWVHGWRNTEDDARKSAGRLFAGIRDVYASRGARYPALSRFKPAYVAIHWPSESSPLPAGYEKIRERAHAMTENGTAEFVLASLLGYLEEQKPASQEVRTDKGKTLRARAGFYVHCLGHSFGGRFLSQAIAAAATPTAPVLSLLPKNAKFEFTVDTFLVFQMAAPPSIFKDRLGVLIDNAPLQGPICLTFSSEDAANCVWHRRIEGEMGIGCEGAREPAGRINWIRLRPLTEAYTAAELAFPVVNLDAGWLFNQSSRLSPQGAHSDIWYEESIHLVLTLVGFSR